MNRAGKVYLHEHYAGYIRHDEDGYSFTYDGEYLLTSKAQAISLLLPLKKESYRSKTMFSFFDGLIPEGWQLERSIADLKINTRDRMALLLALCKDNHGAVSIIKLEENRHE